MIKRYIKYTRDVGYSIIYNDLGSGCVTVEGEREKESGCHQQWWPIL